MHYSYDIKLYNGRPIEIIKGEGEIKINLPGTKELSGDLAYNTRGSDTGIDSFFKIYLKSALTLTGTLPTINGIEVEYDATQNKLSLEKFSSIVLKADSEGLSTFTILSQATLPDIDYVELQMKSNIAWFGCSNRWL